MESDYEMYLYTEITTPDVMPAVEGKASTTEAAREAILSTLFFYPLLEVIEIITFGAFTPVLVFQFTIIGLALAMFCIGYWTIPGENLIVAGILSCIPIGVAISLRQFDFWAIAAIVLWLAGCAIGEGRRMPA